MDSRYLNKLREICKKLGENNKPTYVVMAIAAVKGICRPAFTMMDKTEDTKTKKYTAIREGLTEIIAIPVYWGLGELSAKAAQKYLPQDLQKKGTKNAMLLGVCTAALIVIPGLCSAVIKPIMKTFYHDDQKDITSKKLDIISNSPKITTPTKSFGNIQFYKPLNITTYTYTSTPATNLKVGGV